MIFGVLCSQTSDSALLKNYPYSIGNVAFSTDSMEFVVGDIHRGDVFEYDLGIANLSEKPISFTGGKISKFVTLTYQPALLHPGQTGIIHIEFEVVSELPAGDLYIEIAVESDDTDSPFKFLYMVGQIIEGPGNTQARTLDTVPRLVFNQYNYDFGYLWKGKTLIHSFHFTNMGSENLVINKITSSAGVNFVALPDTIIEPGGFGSVVVKVFTMGDFGVQHRTITIASNDPRNPIITLGIHGTVKAKTPSNQNPDFCYD